MTQTPEASVVAEATVERSAARPPETHRTPTGAAPANAAKKKRDPYLDNAKFLAILLVATGHGLRGLDHQPLPSTVYYFFYMFHMPVFVMISGYLSKRFTLSDDKVVKLLSTTLVPYFIFQTAYSLFAWQFGGRTFQIGLLNPYYITWFLLALFVWRLLTPVWRRMRYPLAVSVFVALVAFTSDLGGTLDIYRILGLMPFYVLGLTLKPEMLQVLRRPTLRVAGAVTLAAGFVATYFAYPHMNARWIRWTDSNADMGVSEMTGTLMRIALLLVGVVLIAAFLAVVPSRRTWYTDLGAATLYTYLLHGFLTRGFTFTGWNEADWLNTIPGILFTAVVCCVVATLLSTSPVRRVTRWAVEPDIRPLFTKE
ncbi:Fucose 4-O-acetylase and related acetyltransferases [Mycobacterium tuberculosis]|nr:Fucose 4-O-acetylase and related acetyltransferases [Mycobacterium tuberculosis]